MCVTELVIQAAGWHRSPGNLSRIAVEEGILAVRLANVDDWVVLVVPIIRDQFGFLYICCMYVMSGPAFSSK